MNLDQLRKLIAGDTLDQLRDKLRQLDEIDKQIDDLHKRREDINRDLQKMVGAIDAPQRKARAPRQSAGGRRTGIRDRVLEALRDTPGMSPAEVRKALGIHDGDKSGSQSVANALSALKREGKIRETAPRQYAAAA